MLEDTIDIALPTKVESLDAALPFDDRPSDSELVRSVIAGDERAFAEIFDRYRVPVARVIGRFFRDRSDIEELMQQSFTKAYFSLKGFHGNDDRSFAGWLSRIAINICYDEFRRRQREASTTVSNLSGEDENDLDVITNDQHTSAETSLINSQLAEKILASIAPEDRIALTLVYSEDYSLNDAAEVIGVSPSSLKSRLFRCRTEIKRRFGYLF